MGGIGGTGTGTGTHQPLGERVMEAIPGTQQHQATHGTTGAHSAVEGVKAYVPGARGVRGDAWRYARASACRLHACMHASR